jgi:hypothetical protein
MGFFEYTSALIRQVKWATVCRHYDYLLYSFYRVLICLYRFDFSILVWNCSDYFVFHFITWE